MRITCPQCQAGYDVDPEKIPPGGLRVRCPGCDRVFSVRIAPAPATTRVGAPPAPPVAPPSVPPAAPPVARSGGMTMVGMAPPLPPSPPVRPDSPVPLPGKTTMPPVPPPASPTFVGVPPPRPGTRVAPPAAASGTTGAIPLPGPAGSADAAPAWPPPEDPDLLPEAELDDGHGPAEPEPAAIEEPLEEVEPLEPVVAAEPEELDMFDAVAPSEPTPVEPPPAPEPAPEPLSFGEVPLDNSREPDPFASSPRAASAPPDEELEMLFSPQGEGAHPPPPPRKSGEVTYKIRRPSGRVFGPFTEREISDMLGKGELNGNEDVSAGEGDEWLAITTVAVFEKAVRQMQQAPLVPETTVPAGGARVPAPFQPRMQSGFREAAVGGWMKSRRTVGLAAALGGLLVVAGIGAAGAMTRHGPFFWKIFRSHGDAAVAKLAAEGRAALAQDAFPSDEKARELAEQGLARRGDDPQGIRLLASAAAALAPRGSDGAVARARQLSASLLLSEPESLAAQEARLAVALAGGDDPATAALALEKLLPADADPETLFLLARASLARGDPVKATAFLDRLDARAPGSSRSARLRASALVRRGDDQGARQVLEAAVAKDPGNAAASLDLAALLDRAGDPGAGARLGALLEKDRLARLGPAERARARVLLAGVLARGGDPVAAEAELELATKDQPGSVDARVELARLQLRRGEAAKAFATLEPIPPSSRSPGASALLARAQLAAGKPVDAANTLDAAIARSADDPELLLAKGLLEQRAGRRPEARKLFEKAAAKAPGGWQAPLALARLSFAEGDLEGAAAQVQVASEKAPGEPDVLAAVGLLAFLRGDLPAADAALAKALAADPRNAAALSGSARLALLRGDVPAARAMAEQAVAADPASADAQLLLGWALWRSGEPEPARKALEAAVALDPRGVLARVRLGAMLLEQKKADEALKELDQATNLDANLAEAQYWMGKTLLAKGDAASAVDRLRRATNLAPGEPLYQVELGDALERSGQLPEAIRAYRGAIQAAPRAPEAYEHLGRLYAVRGDCKQAVPQFQKALEVDPKREAARIEMASCQARLGRSTEAVALYQQALRNDPTRVETYYLIARTVNEAQGLKAAVPWFEKAVVHEPGNAMPHVYLGYWAKEQGQKARAVQEFRKYLAMRPDADDRKDVEREIEDLGGK